MTTKTALISEPRLFFGEGDERHFFMWLKEISAIKSIRGTPGGLGLRMVRPIDKQSFYELAGLMTRYGLDLSSLRDLCDENPDPWFRDPTNYWFKSVFKSKR